MKNELLTIFSIFALFIMLMNIVQAQIASETIGVKPGDWVKYTIRKSHNPRTWIPYFHDAEWVLVNVTEVRATSVIIKEMTDKGSTRRQPLSTATLKWIIPPNLTIGDTVIRIPAEFENGSWRTINLTIDRISNNTYGGVTREIVGVTYNWIQKEYVPGLNETINLNCTLMIDWDRKTGFMVERTAIAKYQNMEYEPSAFSLTISDTNLWQWRSETTSTTILVGAFITILGFVIVLTFKKSKKKAAVVSCISLIFLALTPLVHSPVAAATGAEWAQKWNDYKQYYLTAPINISTIGVAYYADGRIQLTAVLTISIYEYRYDPAVNNSVLYFRTALYIKGNKTSDDYYTPYADFVAIYFEKLTHDESTSVHIVNNEPPPGYSQGKGLKQKDRIESTYEQRYDWIIVPLTWAVSKMSEELSIVCLMISWAKTYNPPEGTDIYSAWPGEKTAKSFWYGLSHDESENPIRQYCFNVIRYKHPRQVYPRPPFVLKVYAEIFPFRALPGFWIQTPPIYLKIVDPQTNGGGGGGIPRPPRPLNHSFENTQGQ